MITYQVTSSATDGYNTQTFSFGSLDYAETFAESEANNMGFAVVSIRDHEVSRFEGGVDGDMIGIMRDTSCAQVDGSGNPVGQRLVGGKRQTFRMGA